MIKLGKPINVRKGAGVVAFSMTVLESPSKCGYVTGWEHDSGKGIRVSFDSGDMPLGVDNDLTNPTFTTVMFPEFKDDGWMIHSANGGQMISLCFVKISEPDSHDVITQA